MRTKSELEPNLNRSQTVVEPRGEEDIVNFEEKPTQRVAGQPGDDGIEMGHGVLGDEAEVGEMDGKRFSLKDYLRKTGDVDQIEWNRVRNLLSVSPEMQKSRSKQVKDM